MKKSPDFDEYFAVKQIGPGLWRAFSRATKKAASPIYPNEASAIHYVEQELIREIEDNIHEMLGGDLEHFRDKPEHE